MTSNLTETHSAHLLSRLLAPHVVQQATFERATDHWVCRKGAVVGTGATPAEAALEFDIVWVGGTVIRTGGKSA